MRRASISAGLIGLFLCASSAIRAQAPVNATDAPAPQKPTFEVASVKPIDPGGACCSPPQVDRGRFAYRNTLYNLIGQAYRAFFPCATKDDSGDCAFPGAPAWIYKDRFAVEATMLNGLPSYSRSEFMGGRTPELNQMLQALLEDRFKLKVHWEARTVPVYTLTVAKNGSKLKTIEKPPETPFGIFSTRLPNGNTRTTLTMQDSSLQDFVNTFEFMDRPVLDRTGLEGSFDFAVVWESEPDEPSNSGPGLLASKMHTGISMFRAIEEQLGLKLEATKSPVQVLVIDHVEQPSAN
jgi:uncharacterized protein (TIGR03435 family)